MGLGMKEKGSTNELQADQLKREYEERELADHANDDESAYEHRRRAEKASYLRHKLEERAESEREAAWEEREAASEERETASEESRPDDSASGSRSDSPDA